MKKLAIVAIWLLVALVATWAAIYFVQHFSSSSFQEGAMGNLFATILGVVVGIPIAVELSRRQQALENAVGEARKHKEESQRREKILSLIRSELAMNRDDLEEKTKNIQTGGKREVHVNTLREEMWSAFSDGGELHYINDPELLALIAGAYYEIRTTIHLERRFMEAIHFPGMTIKRDKYPQDYYLEYLTATDPSVLKAIDMTIKRIDSQIGTVENKRATEKMTI